MIPGKKNSYKSLSSININGKNYKYYSLLKAEKNIAGVKSQFLVLGALEEDGKVVLLHPSQPTKNGLKIA